MISSPHEFYCSLAAEKPLFPRLCKEYRKQIFEGAITSKDIKSYIIRGNRLYVKTRRLIEQHLNKCGQGTEVYDSDDDISWDKQKGDRLFSFTEEDDSTN